jgi:hypothetical protein
VELHQLEPAVAVRGPQHCDVDSDAIEPDDAVRPTSLDWRLALQLHTKFDKERNGSLKVVDDDADVVHPQQRHVPEHRRSTMAAQRRGSVKVLVQPPKDSWRRSRRSASPRVR